MPDAFLRGYLEFMNYYLEFDQLFPLSVRTRRIGIQNAVSSSIEQYSTVSYLRKSANLVMEFGISFLLINLF